MKKILAFLVFTLILTTQSCGIYSFGGDLVFDDTHNQKNVNVYTWYVRNNDSKDIAPGVYFYYIESSQGNSQGKFVILQ